MYLVRIIVVSSILTAGTLGLPMTIIIKEPGLGSTRILNSSIINSNNTHSLPGNGNGSWNISFLGLSLEREPFLVKEGDGHEYIGEESTMHNNNNTLAPKVESDSNSFVDSWPFPNLKQTSLPSIPLTSIGPLLMQFLPNINNLLNPAAACTTKWAVCVTALFGMRKCCIGIICPLDLLCQPIERKK